jgi:hypothetical protein
MNRARDCWPLSALFDHVVVGHAAFNRQDVKALY